LNNAREVQVTTNSGTDLLFNVEGRIAINNSGIYPEWGKGGNIPAGEVYIPPLENLTQGRLVIDGSIRTWKKTILPREPVIVDIEKGLIKKIHKSAMSNLLKDSFAWATRRATIHHEYVKKVAELGIGTNKSAKVIGTTIVDEKTFGTGHVAFGSNFWMGGKTKTICHFDQVFRSPIIRIDGKLFRF
jgi:aminopeptidase